MSDTEEYEAKLAAWKEKHGINSKCDVNAEELSMLAEDKASKKKAYCAGCDEHMPVPEMRIITRRVDPYYQTYDGEGDYIPESDRMRMCPECFKNEYEGGEE